MRLRVEGSQFGAQWTELITAAEQQKPKQELNDRKRMKRKKAIEAKNEIANSGMGDSVHDLAQYTRKEPKKFS